MQEVKIEKSNAGQRLDKYLMKYMNLAPKSFIYKMFRKKNIKLNGNKVTGNELIKESDVITLFLSDETIEKFQEAKPLRIIKAGSLDIIFEDENILILNKPTGLLSHPESADDKDSLVDRMLFYLHENGEYDTDKSSDFTPAICNRLDRNTSGIITAGKNLMAVRALNDIFKNNLVDKYYMALVTGQINEKMVLTGYHTKDEKTNLVEIRKNPSRGSKEVVTEIEPIKSDKNYTLLRIKLVTGKSHQIRAHLKSIHHYIIGDRKYGDKSTNDLFRKNYHIDKQLLHAEEIVFSKGKSFKEIGDGLGYLEGRSFTAPLQKDFKHIAEDVFKNSQRYI